MNGVSKIKSKWQIIIIKKSIHTISLIPLSFPVDSFGLDAGLGGGTMVPTERGVVGLAERKQS